MVVLVTGATGLVGQAVAERFVAAGVAVKALCRSNATTDALQKLSPQLQIAEGDVLDILSLDAAMEGVTHVVHAAAVVSFAPKDRKELYEVNVQGTANVVNVCLAKGIQKLCFVSSVAALGRPATLVQSSDEIYINEQQKWEESPLNSHYAKSKYQAECEVWRGEAEGLPIVIVNPSVILGEGNWHRSSTQLFKYVYDENRFYTEGSLNYVDLLDVAEVIYQLTISETITGQRFILNGGTISFKNFFEKVAEFFGKKAPKTRIGPNLAGVIWRVEAVRSWLTGSTPLITKETAKTARTRFVFQNAAVQQALNFRFRSLDDTLKRVTTYLKTQRST